MLEHVLFTGKVKNEDLENERDLLMLENMPKLENTAL